MPLPAQNELVVTADLQHELGPQNTPQLRRLRVIKEIGEKIVHIRVQEVSYAPPIVFIPSSHTFVSYTIIPIIFMFSYLVRTIIYIKFKHNIFPLTMTKQTIVSFVNNNKEYLFLKYCFSL